MAFKLTLRMQRLLLHAKSVSNICKPVMCSTDGTNIGFYPRIYVGDVDQSRIKYEITKDPEEWKLVERLLPVATVPNYTLKEEYPSNWQPPRDDAKNGPYFIKRTKNHMLPVYLMISHRGQRKITFIKNIQGDIFLLETELKSYLGKVAKRHIAFQVNEFASFIKIKGDYVNLVKEYLLEKGL